MINRKKDNQMKRNDLLFDIKGLSSEEVEQKIKDKQNNVLTKNINKSILGIILSNVFTLFNFLLFLITCLIIHIKHFENLFFLFINILNVSINIFQEVKAKKTLDKISILQFNHTKVIRNGFLTETLIENVVIDDVLFLELGSQIVADSKIIKGVLEVDESLLTGESRSIFKKEGDVLYSGSYVLSGNAYSKVFCVGHEMYISKLTQEAKKYKKIKTPLIQNLSLLIWFIFCLLIPTSLILYFFPAKIDIKQDSFVLGLCGFVLGTLPAGLFLLTSTTLFVSFIKLAKKKAYMKELFGIEMLAIIDVLCLDKTGTITDGTMKVKNILKYKDYNLFPEDLFFDIINVFPQNNPTQKALYQEFCSLSRKNQKKDIYKISKTQPFSSINKYSAVEIDKIGTFVLGAPEFILKKQFSEIKNDFQKETKLGYRVLLLAQTDTSLDNINDNTNYKIISLISLEDQIKEDAFDIINYFIQNGISVKIISGDNSETISYIAKRLNIIKSSKQSINLMNLESNELDDASLKYNVFGRSTPKQKQIIIQNLKKQNHKVAMIGDGVNDILAFKEADVSIAMASGNEASKNTANLILLDSQFHSLPQVVTEGRRVINNLQKISILFLTKTIVSFLLAFVVILCNFYYWSTNSTTIIPFPLKPLQFNLVDTFFIGIPSFFLALEMNNKKVNKSFFRIIFHKAFPYSLLIALFYFSLICFTSLKLDQISFLLSIFIACVFFNLLIYNCIPFNKWKKILIFIVFSGFILSFLFLKFRLQCL
ncbi:HAD-IC family P-type ATPase [Candidatus Phytoplasma ziziphi]|nr:HAD-IC family P-type ATPase [Candidatus Phytoplasma ziziphi]